MYKSWTYITDPIWNNALSYKERIALWSLGEIFVPSLIKWNLDNLEWGSEIVFEEAEFTESRLSGIVNNKLVSCTWLKHFIETSYEWVPVYIFDNHNHAFTFRTHYRLSVWPLERLVVLHIDQHSDIKPNDNQLQMTNDQWPNIEQFVNEKTNVGNFITAALSSWIINEVLQIRTDYALQHIQHPTFKIQNYILDIDVDFRVEKELTEQDIQTIRDLIKKAKLVTIATSPYFIDQQEAIKIIKRLLA